MNGASTLSTDDIFVDPKNIDPKLVSIEHIAYAAARVPRFSGWVDFVVGEHMLEVEYILHEWGHPPLRRLQGLIHDTAECMGFLDLAKPLKYRMPIYMELEKAALACIFKALGIPQPSDEDTKKIKLADNISLLLEAKRDRPQWLERPDWQQFRPLHPLAQLFEPAIDHIQRYLRRIERDQQVSHKGAVCSVFLSTYNQLRREANV